MYMNLLLYKMNKLRNILITILLMGSSFLAAQDCVDDVTGAFAPMGGCAAVLLTQDCDNIFAGTPVADECQHSCDNCPFDPAICDSDGPTAHGCCLPNLNLFDMKNI